MFTQVHRATQWLIATHRNTLQHTATHCNAPQHTPTHYNTTQRTRNMERLTEMALIWQWAGSVFNFWDLICLFVQPWWCKIMMAE